MLCGMLGAPGWAAALEEQPSRITWTVCVDLRTGRLVRRPLVPAGAVRRRDARIERLVNETARRHDLDPQLVHSVIRAESNYDPFAISPKGAQGLMQLMPATARRFGVANTFDPNENLQGGMRYLRYLLDLFGDERLAVAAYNAGEKAVMRHGGVPPYEETERYVRLVLGGRPERVSSAARKAGGETGATASQEAAYPVLERITDAEGNVWLRTR